MRIGPEIERGAGDASERFPDLAGIAVTGDRQSDRLSLAQEEFDAELALQRLDLPADRTLREIKLSGGGRDTPGPSSGFECSQQRKRWEKTACRQHQSCLFGMIS